LQALKLVDKTKFQTSIFKEYERIILYGLLKDTVNFDSKLKQFKKQFNSSDEFAAYYGDLVKFNRTDYINSY